MTMTMESALPLLLFGFSLGMRHATDVDHVIAVATVVSRVRSLGVALLIGAMWGLGHTVTLLLVGGAILVFGLAVPPRVGLALELAVAVMLIGLGALHLGRAARALRGREPAAPAEHGPGGHHHGLGCADRWFGGSRVYLGVRPLLIGVVHGVAGSAAVALLVLTTVRDPRWGVGYLALFGTGTIAGMMVITAALAVPFALTRARFGGAQRTLGTAAGCLSVGFGLFLVYDIGIVSGLFTGNPRWTPG
jgi:hypothetical protein